MALLGGKVKEEPLHYGEVFALWQHSIKAKAIISGFKGFRPHAEDKELKKLLDEFIAQLVNEMTEIDELLLENGVSPAPNSMPERPEVEHYDIPAGARCTDPLMTAIMGLSFTRGMSECCQAVTIAVREDVGAMFLKYLTQKALLGGKLMKLTKKKGWIVSPPVLVGNAQMM